MPVQTIPSLLLQELGQEFVKAHEQAKQVKPKQGQTLPSGVKGIAQLRDISIKKIKEGKNAGKLMFYADAIIQEPVSHGGFPVKGKRTFITEPIYATPTRKRKTIKEHLDEIYGILKMLGIPIEKLNPKDIEPAMASLKATKGGVFITFRTWQPPTATEGQYAGKDAMLMQFWDERITGYKKQEANTNVQVDLPDEIVNSEPVVSEPEPEPNHTVDSDNTQEVTSEMLEGDLDSLGKRADNDKDLDACNRLTQWALEKGISQDQINAVDSWSKLVELIKGSASTNGEAKEISIAVGEHWNYKPIDPKTKEKVASPIGVEILSINAEAGTVNLCQIKNRKFQYQNVPASELEEMK